MEIDNCGWVPPQHDPAVPTRQQAQDWNLPVQAIGAALGRDLSSARMFPTGSDIVFGDGQVVVKLTRPRWADEIQAEARLLNQVQGRLPVQTPSVLASGRVEGWPFVVMTHVPGIAIAEIWPTLAAPERARLAVQIGETIRALHALPATHDPGWEVWLRDCEDSAVRRHRGPPHLVEAIPAFLTPFEPGAPVLLHTEIYDQHVLVDPDRLDVVSLIDFADGRVGDPRYEVPALVELLFREDHASLEACVAATGIELDADELLAWSLRHRYGQLERWLAFVSEAPGSLSELARAVYPERSTR